MLECPHLFFKDCLKFGHKVLKTQSHKAYILCPCLGVFVVKNRLFVISHITTG